MKPWYKEESDIVVSSRIRLARNLRSVPFPHKLSDTKIKEITDLIKNNLIDMEFSFGKLHYLPIEEHIEEAAAMVERHIISPQFLKNNRGRGLLLSDDESVSIMLCEEDHIRIQVLLGGDRLKEAYKIASEVDKAVNQKLDIAVSNELGFLTECPTNLGSGLRASLMLHLPALESFGSIKTISDSLSKIGFTVRGLYGEGSNAVCSMFQVSNQVTLGLEESQALNNLENVAKQIINQERHSRDELDLSLLEDKIYRAYGTLKYARLLTSSEMMGLLSLIKLGISMGIIKDIKQSTVTELLIECEPNMLQQKNGRMTPTDRDIARASLVRKKL